ncbi:MAG TPA: NAD(P)/FAD-dependent oxidoreductase [Candidatus Limnocylindria bacterium]|nr:NAD(P)/FAD-dependent oxidoreductase [Candidatus Limnocylindria bacterium]
MRTRRTAVLGGGALGLTAALRLAQRGERVTVIEREPLPGGLAAGFEIEPGMWLEKFYHHLFRSDTRAIALFRELGLEDRLEWKAPVTATLHGGRVHRLDSPTSLLRFTPLPILDRVRMGAALAVLKAMPDPRLLEGRTAEAWLRRWMGRRGYEVVWEPLLRGKFGATASTIAMPWFWGRVHDRTTQLGYPRGGFQQLYFRLADEIRRHGGEVRLGESVKEVRTADDSTLDVETDAGVERFDRVISTLAVRLTARLVPELPQAWRDRHEWGQAFGAHCLVLALDRPLTSAYWLNVNDPGYPFMALVEHTNYVPAGEYGGRHLVYLGNYRPMDDPLMTASRDAVLDEMTPAVARINPAFARSWVTDAWSFAAPFAQPIVTVDYREHIPPFTTPIPNLFVASMFQVYPHDRGQNYSIDLAERLVSRLS